MESDEYQKLSEIADIAYGLFNTKSCTFYMTALNSANSLALFALLSAIAIFFLFYQSLQAI